jgi:hypothetical protein
MFTTSNKSIQRPKRLLAGLLAAGAVAATLVLPAVTPGVAEAAGPGDYDWVGIVNTYRAQSGLAPITANASWSAGAVNHSCWMLLNGIAHDEAPGTPGYTTAGDQAGNSGNVAVSSVASATPRSHIDLWMAGPFHAIGVLRPSLAQAGYGLCSSPPNPSTTVWKSGGTLDVVRGNNWGAAKPATPVVFPGNGSTTSLTKFVAESPDPRTFCNWSGRKVGLPLIALMPSNVTSATATLTGPSGPVPTCVLTKSNTSGVASSILGGDNAVIVVPAAPLGTGTYTVSVNSNGGAANWSFNVDPNAPLVVDIPDPVDTKVGTVAGFESITPFRFADSRVGRELNRLQPNRQVKIKIAGRQGLPSDITAVSANFTVVRPDGAGYFTAYNCAGGKPSVSTLNYNVWETVPNQGIIPLTNGYICIYSVRTTDVLIDVNGYVSASATKEFVPLNPKRLFDSRSSKQLRKGETLRLVVEGGKSPAPSAAVAVALNITGVLPEQSGWIRAFPCDAKEPNVSSLNPRLWQSRANSAIVPTAADGSICLTSNVTTHVVVDITGWFGPVDNLEFVPLDSIRLGDTRSTHPDLNPRKDGRPLQSGKIVKIQVAGARGVPESAKAATLNIVSVHAQSRGWLRIVPCGSSSDVSNLNYLGILAIANGANVKLDANGAVCVTTKSTTHVVVDVTGVWT